jgi:hypothetical protein
MDGLKVVYNGPKRAYRKTHPFYYKKLSHLQPGHIVQIQKKSWYAACSSSPRSYINTAYKGYYKVIQEDSKSFIVQCLERKKRFY